VSAGGGERHVVCNLCGEEGFTILYPRGAAQKHRIVACPGCGLMYANPQGEPDSSRALKAEPPDRLPDERKPQEVQKETVQLRDYAKIISVLEEEGLKSGKVLEVGASTGSLLNEFRRAGWETLGVDPSKGAAIYARKKYDIEVLPVTLKEAGLEAGSFDAVIMLHVVEHMGDPMEEMGLARQALGPRGILVLETPRYDSLIFRILGRRERSLSCDGHLYFFTTRTIRLLAERSGLSPGRLELVGRTLTADRLLYNVGVMSKSARVRRLLEGLSGWARADRFVLHLNFRDMLRLYCRKG